MSSRRSPLGAPTSISAPAPRPAPRLASWLAAAPRSRLALRLAPLLAPLLACSSAGDLGEQDSTSSASIYNNTDSTGPVSGSPFSAARWIANSNSPNIVCRKNDPRDSSNAVPR